MTIDGLDQLRGKLAAMSDRRFKAAVATGITRTAVAARDALKAELPKVFDRPTPYTMAQARYSAARADRLWAEVGFDIEAVTNERGVVQSYRGGQDTPASRYLGPGVYGGGRNVKRFERAMQASGYMPSGWVTAPGPGAKLDSYGNVSRGQVIQILSQLRITWTLGHTRNMAQPNDKRGQASARAAVKRAGGRYFVIPVGAGGKQPGVYLRDIGARHALLVLVFVKPPAYSRRLDFDGLMQGVAAQQLPGNVRRALAESLERMGGGA